MPDAFEIDFLPVGDKSKSGDAIALRFGTYENGVWKKQTVFVIDGGNMTSGESLVTHINDIYKTDKVDRVILTHPDGDHASGLRAVVENMKVGKIWMHRPWNHWDDLASSIIDGRITKNSFGERLRTAYQYAYDIEQIAIKKKIEFYQPRQGGFYRADDEKILQILAPGKDFYLSLIQVSDKTPNMDISEGLMKSFAEAEREKANEDMTFETENLSEEDENTSAENDMSLILYFTFAGKKVLFTGDAGTMGLYKAIRYAIESNIDLKKLDLLQIPHHGSKHNLSKGVLQHIYAPQGVISCAKEGEPVHYSKIITNALRRRNIIPYKTQGTLLSYHSPNIPRREGYSGVIPIPFHPVVEL